MKPDRHSAGVTLGFSLRPGWADTASHIELFATLKNAGVQAVETQVAVAEGRDQSLVSDAHALGLSISYHATGAMWYAARSDRRILESVRKTLEEINATVNDSGRPAILNIHPAEGAPSRAGNLALTLDSLSMLASLIEGEGLRVTLAVENLPYDPWSETRVGTDPRDIVTIVEEINSPLVGITWDIAHYEGALRSHVIPEWLGDDFIRRVRHAHISDFSPGYGDHLPLGYGSVPYCDYMARLGEAEDEITVVMEIDYDKAVALGNPISTMIESFRRLEGCAAGVSRSG